MSLAHPKNNFIKNERFKRWVSQFPCFVCGLHGSSQAAHLENGGRGIKTHDKYCVSLCHSKNDSNGKLIEGCHKEYDGYKPNPLRPVKGAVKGTMDIVYALFEQGRLDEAETTYMEAMLWKL